jgi:hypothetical protein
MQKEETTRYVEILPYLAQEMIRLRVVREEEEEMIVSFIEATLAALEEEELLRRRMSFPE